MIKQLYKALCIIIGLGGAFLLVYFRIFHERLAYDLTTPITTSKALVFISIIMINVIILIILVYKSFLREDKKETILHGFTEKVMKFRETIVYELRDISRIIIIKIPNFDIILLTLLDSLFNYKKINKLRWVVSLIIIVPRGIVLFVFLLDTFYFQSFNYFYKYIGLLLIPYIIDIVIFIYEDVRKATILMAREVLIFYANNDLVDTIPREHWDMVQDIIGYPLEYIYPCTIFLRPEYQNQFSWEDSNEITKLYFIAIGVRFLIRHAEQRQQLLNFWVGIIWRILYIIGFTYALLLGFGIV